MRNLICLLALTLFPASAFAWPGSETLRCQSVAGSQSIISLEIWKAESNADDMPAGVKLTINGKIFSATDENSAVKYIHFVSAPADKVFTANYEQTVAGWEGSLRLWALAATFEQIGDTENRSESHYRFQARMRASIWHLNEEGAFADLTEMECKHSYYHGS